MSTKKKKKFEEKEKAIFILFFFLNYFPQKITLCTLVGFIPFKKKKKAFLDQESIHVV